MTTQPAETALQPDSDRPPFLVLHPQIKDEATGQTFTHKDYVETAKPWEEAEHRPYVNETTKFGDVPSLVAYLDRYAEAELAIARWNSQGVNVVLDYHYTKDHPGERGQRRANLTTWRAEYPFIPTPEWADWSKFAGGQAIPHATFVEFIDDHLLHVSSDRPDLLNIIKKLRSSTTMQAEQEVRTDGTASVSFTKNDEVKAEAGFELPPEIEITIPIMRGHDDDDDQPINYKLVLRLRASVDQGKLFLRLHMPAREAVLEQVYADMIASVRAGLDAASMPIPIYRTAG